MTLHVRPQTLSWHQGETPHLLYLLSNVCARVSQAPSPEGSGNVTQRERDYAHRRWGLATATATARARASGPAATMRIPPPPPPQHSRERPTGCDTQEKKKRANQADAHCPLSAQQVQLRPPPARLALRALRGLHGPRRRQQQAGCDAEPEQAGRRIRIWLPGCQRHGQRQRQRHGERAPGRGEPGVQAGDAQQEVSGSPTKHRTSNENTWYNGRRELGWGESPGGERLSRIVC